MLLGFFQRHCAHDGENGTCLARGSSGRYQLRHGCFYDSCQCFERHHGAGGAGHGSGRCQTGTCSRLSRFVVQSGTGVAVNISHSYHAAMGGGPLHTRNQRDSGCDPAVVCRRFSAVIRCHLYHCARRPSRPQGCQRTSTDLVEFLGLWSAGCVVARYRNGPGCGRAMVGNGHRHCRDCRPAGVAVSLALAFVGLPSSYLGNFFWLSYPKDTDVRICVAQPY